MTNLNDLFYIQRVKAGDVQAFSHVVVRYQQQVLTLVFRITGNREDAEDLTQEIFIRAFKSLHQFREEAEFSTWLYRIAYNTTLSEIRRKKLPWVPLEENVSGKDDKEWNEDLDTIGTEERFQYLDQALKQLPADEVLLVTLFYLNEQSIDEISQITGLTIANIKVKLHRIRKKLAAAINKRMYEK